MELKHQTLYKGDKERQMSDILKKLGDKAKDVTSSLKSLPPSDSEAQGIAEAQKQVDALHGTPAAAAPTPTSSAPVPTEEEKANPLTRYGAKPGEKRLDTSYLDQPTAVKAPVYDRGGEVGIIGGTNNNARPMPTMRLPAYDGGGEVKVRPSYSEQVATRPKIQQPVPSELRKDKPVEVKSPYDANSNLQKGRSIPEDEATRMSNPTPVYDEGTPEVDVNDGKHQVAILKDGESVLTPEETEQRKAEQASKVEAPSPALKTQDAKSTDEGQPLTQKPEEDTSLKPYSQVIEDKANAKAAEKVAAQPEGAAPAEGGAQPQAEEKPKLTYGHLLAEQYGFIPKGFNQGSQGVPNVEQGMTAPAALGQSKPAPAQGPMKPMNLPAGPAQPNTSSERGADYKARLAQLQQDHAKALASRTLDGNVQADYIANQINDLKKNNPWGTAGNHPGILGKIGHVAEMIGSRAPGLAPIVGTLPGSEMDRANEMRGNRADTKQDEAAAAANDKANNGGAGKPLTNNEKVYNDLTTGGENGGPKPNPDTGKPYTAQEANVASQGTGKTPEELYIQEQMRTPDPKTGKAMTRPQAQEQYLQMKAGTKPLNEQERRVADYLSSRHQEDTPANREAARTAIEKADVEAKAASALPFSEQKSTFTNKLSTERDLLVQQNADANARGIKADELQNTENARSSSVSAKITTARDALNNADEDQFAAQVAPVLSLLAMTSAEGVKRVNKQELDKFVPTAGSFGRWIDAHAEQFLAGKIPADYRTEVGHMLDRMDAAEVAEHKINGESIDGTIRQGAQTPVQKPGGGAKSTPAKSKSQAAAPEVPKGATGTAPDPRTGKLYYHDAQGKVLGEAPSNK